MLFKFCHQNYLWNPISAGQILSTVILLYDGSKILVEVGILYRTSELRANFNFWRKVIRIFNPIRDFISSPVSFQHRVDHLTLKNEGNLVCVYVKIPQKRYIIVNSIKINTPVRRKDPTEKEMSVSLRNLLCLLNV